MMLSVVPTVCVPALVLCCLALVTCSLIKIEIKLIYNSILESEIFNSVQPLVGLSKKFLLVYVPFV